MASQVHLVEYIITTLDHLYRYTLVLQLSGSPVVQQSRISSSGETLLWDNRRLIGRSLIVLARKVQNNRD